MAHDCMERSLDRGGRGLMEEIGRDPAFRSQYEGGVAEDPQVEEALGGPHAPRLQIRLAPATQPLSTDRFMTEMPVRLR
jgi:hypothetical protein